RRLVTPLMAETTATHGVFRAAAATICAALAMQEASPTEVPPNFMTCKRDFMTLRPAADGLRNFQQGARPFIVRLCRGKCAGRHARRSVSAKREIAQGTMMRDSSRFNSCAPGNWLRRNSMKRRE